MHGIQVSEVCIYSILGIPQSPVPGPSVYDRNNKPGPNSASVTLGQDEKEIHGHKNKTKTNKSRNIDYLLSKAESSFRFLLSVWLPAAGITALPLRHAAWGNSGLQIQ